jgi:hypothetical protein
MGEILSITETPHYRIYHPDGSYTVHAALCITYPPSEKREWAEIGDVAAGYHRYDWRKFVRLK